MDPTSGGLYSGYRTRLSEGGGRGRTDTVVDDEGGGSGDDDVLFSFTAIKGGRQRKEKKQVKRYYARHREIAGQELTKLMAGNEMPVSQDAKEQLATALCGVIRVSAYSFRDIFDMSRALKVVNEVSELADTEDAPTATKAKRTVLGDGAVKKKKKDYRDTLDEAAVEESRKNKEALYQRAEEKRQSDQALLESGADILNDLVNTLDDGFDPEQLDTDTFDELRDLYKRVTGFQSLVGGMGADLKAQGDALAKELQINVIKMQERSIAIDDWEGAAAPDGFAFINAQRPTQVADEDEGGDTKRRGSKATGAVKNFDKALIRRKDAFRKEVGYLETAGNAYLTSRNVTSSRDRGAMRIVAVTAADAAAAMSTLKAYQQQRRVTEIERNEDVFDTTAIFSTIYMPTAAAPVESFSCCANVDNTTSDMMQELFEAFYTPPARIITEAATRTLHKKKRT